MADMQALTEAIVRAYKSLEQPNFAFVSKAVSKKPYASVEQQMRSLFEVEEVTDTNDDVSFGFLLSKSGIQWRVELSMIGRYAVVLRTAPVILVTQDTSLPDEQKICSLLVENQFKIMTQQELEQPFPLKLFNADPENVCIYQVLFSDLDVLPWK